MKFKPMLILPLVVVVALFSVFGYALMSGVNPKEVPSALTGSLLPEFKLADLDDTSEFLSREDITGKPMLVNIWATWCSSCKYEHPFLNSLAADGIRIIGVNYKDDRDLAAKWLSEYTDPYQINVFDPNGDLGFDLGVTGAPETFFVDSQGHVQYRYQGPITNDLWQNKLKAIFDGMV
ncbi:MAG: DsbE family thiol:disulfide interchange protein [Reinekea sp.]|jgi:cytochrome c biogenesis protein CcmG, thiol:disulfide interchange protein DsbE